jgi:hypothetical protein
MIMDPNQLEDADRRGINPYEESYLAATYNRRQELGATVAQATGEPSPGAGSWGDYPPVDDGPDEFGPARSSLNPTEQAQTSPPDQPEPGTVVGFTKRFREDGPGYAYVAIHIKGRGWYLTGSDAGARTWAELVEFADGAQLWVTRDWTRLS